MHDFLSAPRFTGIKPFKSKGWLSSPTMHGDEQRWVDEAIKTNWVFTVGEHINEVEKQVAEIVGRQHTVALSSGTVALHLVINMLRRWYSGIYRHGVRYLEYRPCGTGKSI